MILTKLNKLFLHSRGKKNSMVVSHGPLFPFYLEHHHCTSSLAIHPFLYRLSISDQTYIQGQGLAGFHVLANEDACALLLLIKLNEHSVWFEPSNQMDPANRNTITSATIRVNHCTPFFSVDSCTLRSLRPSFPNEHLCSVFTCQTTLIPETISLWPKKINK